VRPIVLFQPHRLGWNVRALHTPPGRRRRCDALTTSTPFR
jgi:hypothetical protein